MKTNSSSISSVDFTEVYELLLETFNPVPTLLVFDKVEEPFLWLKDDKGKKCLVIPIASVDDMKNSIRMAAKKSATNCREESMDVCLYSDRSADLYREGIKISKFLNIPCPLIYIGTKEYMEDSDGLSVMIPFGKKHKYIVPHVWVKSTNRKYQYYLLAHEIRHCWQHIQSNIIFPKYIQAKKSVYEYMLQPAEIDAEAFAHYYIKREYGLDGDELLIRNGDDSPYISEYHSRLIKQVKIISETYNVR